MSKLKDSWEGIKGYYQARDFKYHMTISPVWLLSTPLPQLHSPMQSVLLLLLLLPSLFFYKPFFILINIQKALKSKVPPLEKEFKIICHDFKIKVLACFNPNPGGLSQCFFNAHNTVRKLTFIRSLTVRVNGSFLHFCYSTCVTWNITWDLVGNAACKQALPRNLNQDCVSNSILSWLPAL